MNLHSGKRHNISPALLIGSSYNYFAVSKKCPDLKEEMDQANAEDRKMRILFIKKIFIKGIFQQIPLKLLRMRNRTGWNSMEQSGLDI